MQVGRVVVDAHGRRRHLPEERAQPLRRAAERARSGPAFDDQRCVVLFQHRGQLAEALHHVAEVLRPGACRLLGQHHQEVAHGAIGGTGADIGGILFDGRLALALVRVRSSPASWPGPPSRWPSPRPTPVCPCDRRPSPGRSHPDPAVSPRTAGRPDPFAIRSTPGGSRWGSCRCEFALSSPFFWWETATQSVHRKREGTKEQLLCALLLLSCLPALVPVGHLFYAGTIRSVTISNGRMSYSTCSPSTFTSCFVSSSRLVRCADADRETGGQHHGPALALGLVEAHDDPVAVLGLLHRLDDHVGGIGLEKTGDG